MRASSVFFQTRGAQVNIETCPLADGSLARILIDRRYRIIEFSNVLYRELDSRLGAFSPISGVRVIEARREEYFIWAETAARGFSEGSEVSPIMREAALVFFEQTDARHILVEVDGVIAAAGAIAINEGIGNIFGTSTLLGFRGRGAQSALIRACLELAASMECTLVMATTACGSSSQRNFERQGFRIAYTRTKFLLD